MWFAESPEPVADSRQSQILRSCHHLRVVLKRAFAPITVKHAPPSLATP